MARVFKLREDSKTQATTEDCFDLKNQKEADGGQVKCVITLKGAPDILIKQCAWIINDDGTQSKLDEKSLARLKQIQNEWCLLGQRVLLICKKTESESHMIKQGFSTSPAAFETYLKETKDLCVLGMVGIIDKPREGIENVIRTCRQAGVRIFMVCGILRIFRLKGDAYIIVIIFFSSHTDWTIPFISYLLESPIHLL